MKKRLVISLVLVGLLAFGAGLGTYAWFTSSATSSNNQFTAGELEVNNETAFDLTQVGTVILDNLQPGDEESFTFTVDNTGSLDMKYRINLTSIAGDLTTGNTPIQIKLDNGTWADISGSYYEDPAFVIQANGAAVTHTLYVKLPGLANNTYQEADGSFNVTVEATQTTNGGWTQNWTPAP